MGHHYASLLEKVNEIHDLEKISWLLSWDREVVMPEPGNRIRTHQISTLSRLRHNIYTSDEMGELIEKAKDELSQNGKEDGPVPQALIRWLERDYNESRKIPEEFVKRRDLLSGAALPAWKQAREEDNFTLFEPYLQQLIEIGQEQAGYQAKPEDECTYDALLSGYERGIQTSEIEAIFNEVKAGSIPLIQAIAEKTDFVDDSFLHQSFPVETQKEVAPYFAKAVGYDFDRGHLGTATHPFASSMSRDDARITTRWYPDFINPAIFGVMHESGHAIYEQGTGTALERTPLARGTSMGIHESQSRMMENLVGRSLGFWKAHYHVLQGAFPEQLENVSVEAFYRAVNKVQPSLIRVEADELTYNMHIILRFELEQEMLNGNLNAKDIPDAWNAKMEALLGLTPPNNRVGCLQDIHWVGASFGYFPTYALGNLYASQILDTAKADVPAIQAELETGEVGTLKGWLGDHIHTHGRMYDPPELIKRITGSPLNPKPFLDYVTKKFSAIYEL